MSHPTQEIDWAEEARAVNSLTTRLRMIDRNSTSTPIALRVADEAVDHSRKVTRMGSEIDAKFGMATWALQLTSVALGKLLKAMSEQHPETMAEINDDPEYMEAITNAGVINQHLMDPDFSAADALQISRQEFLRQVLEAQGGSADDNVVAGNFGARPRGE